MKNSITSTRTALLAAGVLSLAAFGVGTAGAQAPGAQPGQPPGQPPAQAQPAMPPPATSNKVDEMTLANFVDAYEDVMEIQKGLMEDMSDVTDRDEANALQQEARSEMMSAVESNDLSVDQFNQIVRGMQQDPKLNERVQSALNLSER